MDIHVTAHAISRLNKRGGFNLDEASAKSLLVSSVLPRKSMLEFFGGGTVHIDDTKLKAVTVVSDEGVLTVVTVITNNMYEGSLCNRRKSGKKRGGLDEY